MAIARKAPVRSALPARCRPHESSLRVVTYLLDWAQLLARWLHLIAGIAWIGASFYFVWLDNHLQPPRERDDDLAGELWAVHGGGFYVSQKCRIAPRELPATLHSF